MQVIIAVWYLAPIQVEKVNSFELSRVRFLKICENFSFETIEY